VTGRWSMSVVSSEGCDAAGGCEVASPRPAPPLVRLRSRSASRCLRQPVARYGFRAPSTSLRVRRPVTADLIRIRRSVPRDLEVFPAAPGRDRPEPIAFTLTELRPLQGMTARARRAAARTTRTRRSNLRGSFSGVSAPSALAARGVHVPSAGFASPGYVPSPGFRTLLTACSSARPAGLFHPAGAHGVRPSEPSSRATSRAASRRPLPS
jgi:hypothetical protein